MFVDNVVEGEWFTATRTSYMEISPLMLSRNLKLFSSASFFTNDPTATPTFRFLLHSTGADYFPQKPLPKALSLIPESGSATALFIAYAFPLLVAFAASGPASAADYQFDTDAGTTTVQNTPLTGADGLNKQGAGTLQLTAINTYMGATSVSGGSLRVENGGQLTSTSSVTVAGANASLTVNGAGSKATTTTTTIGSAAGGVLTIENGGEVTNTGRLFLTDAVGDTATLNISGAGSLLTTGSISTRNAQNMVNVTDGGRIWDQGTGGLLFGRAGTFLVSGAGSLWDTDAAFLMVGGSLSVLDGGVFSSNSINMGGVTAIVSGAGSQITGTNLLLNGTAGSASTLTLAQGGVATFGAATAA